MLNHMKVKHPTTSASSSSDHAKKQVSMSVCVSTPKKVSPLEAERIKIS